LDKKAVVTLMTECFENHGIDKKKLEEMKYIQLEGALPPSKNKALTGAKDKLIRGLKVWSSNTNYLLKALTIV
jgi:hypothetical protein